LIEAPRPVVEERWTTSWQPLDAWPDLREDVNRFDDPIIFYPDDVISDHSESEFLSVMKGDRVGFLSDRPRPQAGVYDAMGVGSGGGTAFGSSRMNIRAGSSGTRPPDGIRVRTWFPETLAWKPLVITDENGRATLDVDLADSITTWRLAASASSADGRLGSSSRGLVAFQPFFVDIDFPVALTMNDEVSVPVAVYNYLKEAQSVSLKVERESWFELEGEPFARIDLGPGEVKAVFFRVHVKEFGRHRLTVYAWGADEAARDAIRREVEVVPDGKLVEIAVNDRLEGKFARSIRIPENAIPGTPKIFAKVYPGVYAQVVDGVEGMLGAPHG